MERSVLRRKMWPALLSLHQITIQFRVGSPVYVAYLILVENLADKNLVQGELQWSEAPSPSVKTSQGSSKHFDPITPFVLWPLLTQTTPGSSQSPTNAYSIPSLQTIYARELHFKFSTPSTKSVFRDEETGGGEDNCPCAPKQHRAAKSRLRGQNLERIAVNLSASYESMLS